ncbi:hypothetical protein ACGFY7_32265 [Streptomyces prunicolor]
MIGYTTRRDAILIVFLWAAGAVILGVIWLVTNSRSASREPRERPPNSW